MASRKSARRAAKPLWRRLLGRLILLTLAMVLAWHAWVYAQIWWWATHPPQSTAFMSNRLDTLQEQNSNATLQYKWVPYERISSSLKRAVMVAEDSGFTQHDGFDWDGIEAAWQKNIKKGRIVAGGSTISQQLAKNLFLSGTRSPVRKGEEAIITLMIEQRLEKRRIFEIYLNVIEWGNGVFGAEAAARHYFGVSAANLSPQQAAKLAAMIPNPRYYDKHRSTRYLNRRTATIARRMNQVRPPR
ncbi:MAG: monofunctional biosynthetic peptidoglycan transglycosylase [Paraperlucidibaca sp.]